MNAGSGSGSGCALRMNEHEDRMERRAIVEYPVWMGWKCFYFEAHDEITGLVSFECIQAALQCSVLICFVLLSLFPSVWKNCFVSSAASPWMLCKEC